MSLDRHGDVTEHEPMRFTALFSALSLLSVSLHVTVDHGLIEYCHMISAHSEEASHGEVDPSDVCSHHSLSHNHNGAVDPHQGHCHVNHGQLFKPTSGYHVQDSIPTVALPSHILGMSSASAASLPDVDLSWCPPDGGKAYITFSSLQI